MKYKIFALLVPLFALAGCSTVIEGPTQTVRFETPGAAGAICFLERPGYRRRVWAPNEVSLTKSSDPLEVTCLAPGNRTKTIIVEPSINETTFWNVTTAGLGGFVDYETGGMFKFPELIVVDFTDMPPQPMPEPEYQNLIAEYPALAGWEEFRPGISALERDRYRTTPTLRPRQAPASAFSQEQGLSEVHLGEESVFLESGGEGRITADELTRQMNPEVFQSNQGMGGGVPLINSAPGNSSAESGAAQSAPLAITP